MPLQRKKWTEEEERALMDKYAEMASDGSLARMRTREKKFRPIAAHVNAAHHALDPATYPHLWSWKDASTKVQNMRHQYLLVKQKLFSAAGSPTDGPDGDGDRIDWTDGVNFWPNFLRYRDVFGDAPLPPAKPREPDPPPAPGAAVPFPPAAGVIDGDDGDLGLGLGFECCGGEDVEEEGFDYEEVAPVTAPAPAPVVALAPRKRRRRRKPERRRAWAEVAGQLARLAEREARLDEGEVERERERRRRTSEASEEAARRRREEEREWEERMDGRRAEWRKRVEGMLSQHRAEMEQIQARILHDQQSIVNQLLGFLSHWAASPVIGGGLADGGAGIGNHHHHQHQHHHQQHYLSQMLQGLHHVNGIVPGDNRVGGDSQEDQFIVDE